MCTVPTPLHILPLYLSLSFLSFFDVCCDIFFAITVHGNDHCFCFLMYGRDKRNLLWLMEGISRIQEWALTRHHQPWE